MNVAELLAGSLRLVGVKASGEALTADEAADGLVVVNDVLEGWNLERLMIPGGLDPVTLSVTPGLQVHTIGTGGSLNTPRPAKIDSAAYVVGGTEIPIEIVDEDGWSAIPTKNQTGANPLKLWYDPAYPLGKVYLWPYPNAAYSLVLWRWAQFPAFAAVTDTVILPPGHTKALRYAVALELAAEYGRPVPQSVVVIAQESKAAIKSLNISTPVLACDPALLTTHRGSGLGDFLAGV